MGGGGAFGRNGGNSPAVVTAASSGIGFDSANLALNSSDFVVAAVARQIKEAGQAAGRHPRRPASGPKKWSSRELHPRIFYI